MASSSYVGLIARIPIQGTLYNTYTTAKSVITSTASEATAGFQTLPPNFFTRGGAIRITIEAGISNRVTGPDTFTIQVMVGAVIAFTTGAINLTTTAHTTIPARFVINLSCQKEGTGSTAQLMGQCVGQGQMLAMAASLADGAANTGWVMAPNTAPTLGTGFDSTIAESLDLFVAQSVNNAGNGFQLAQYWVESLGNTAP